MDRSPQSGPGSPYTAPGGPHSVAASPYNAQQPSAVDAFAQRLSSMFTQLFEPIVSEPSRPVPNMSPVPAGGPQHVRTNGSQQPRGGPASAPSDMGENTKLPEPPPVQRNANGNAGYDSPQPQAASALQTPPAPQVQRQTTPSSSSQGYARNNGSPQETPNAAPRAAPKAQPPTASHRELPVANGGAVNRQASMPRSQQESPAGSRSHGSMPRSQQDNPAGARTYSADPDDLLDQHVAYYFRHHPEVYKRHHIVRKRPGVYELNGREIGVEWQYGVNPGEQGFLVAVDGPLRQPFADYMTHTEANAEYINEGLATAALHGVPRPDRMTFHDENTPYGRLEAMKVAKEQAIVREKAAEYAQQGIMPPQDLRRQYEKTLARKLNAQGRQYWSNPAAGPEPQAAPTPAAPAPTAAAAQQQYQTAIWPNYQTAVPAAPMNYQTLTAAPAHAYTANVVRMPQQPLFNFR